MKRDETTLTVERLQAALSDLVEWVSGHALDHVPDDVYHKTGGYEILQAARSLTE